MRWWYKLMGWPWLPTNYEVKQTSHNKISTTIYNLQNDYDGVVVCGSVDQLQLPRGDILWAKCPGSVITPVHMQSRGWVHKHVSLSPGTYNWRAFYHNNLWLHSFPPAPNDILCGGQTSESWAQDSAQKSMSVSDVKCHRNTRTWTRKNIWA